MIRTIPIPTTVGRMGCSPGADCCDECRHGHTGPPIGPAAAHVHRTLGRLGQLQCDQDGNCFLDGVSVSQNTSLETASATTGGLSNTALYILGGLLIVGLLEATGRKGR